MADTPNNIQAILDSTQWPVLGEGSFNRAFLSQKTLTIFGYTGQWVLKKPKDNSLCSDIDRAIRKWNLHNPDFPTFRITNGWIMPYLGNTPASDEQIAEKLVEIYQNTGEIIADACGNKNFLYFQNKVICIDMDLSLHRGSIASENYLKEVISLDKFQYYLADHEINYEKPKTVAVIKALFYLEQQLPNYDKHQHITPGLIRWLHGFRRAEEPISNEIMDTLLEIARLDPNDEIKDVCFNLKLIKTIHDLKQHNAITKDQIKHLAHEQLWDPTWWAGKLNKEQSLEAITCAIQANPSCINKTGPSGYTLLHLAAMYPHCDLAHYLMAEGAALNTVTPTTMNKTIDITYPSVTPIEIALQSGNYITKLLAEKGAVVPPEIIALLPETDKINHAEALTQLYTNLYDLATDTGNLSEARKEALLRLIKTHTQLLTWQLDKGENSFISLAFHANHTHVINELVQLPEWEALSQTRNKKSGWTLWHIAALVGSEENCKHLKTTNIHAVTKRSQSSALHMAMNRGNPSFCKTLLMQGANPMQKDRVGDTPEAYWDNKKNPTNPFIQLRRELAYLATNTGNLSDTQKADLLTLIKQHTHFLTWPLTGGKPFLHLIFECNQTIFINEVVKLPEWHELSKTKNTQTGCDLFSLMAYLGQAEHYARLKHLPTNPSDWAVALRASARGGHKQFCQLLLADGANPNLKNKTGETAETLWCANHPLKKNPFNRHCHVQNLEQKKKQINALINTRLPQNSFFFGSSKDQITLINLQQTITQATFSATTHPDRTANELLANTVNIWEMSNPNVRTPSSLFFFTEIEEPSILIMAVLESIRALLPSKEKPPQVTSPMMRAVDEEGTDVARLTQPTQFQNLNA